MPDIYSAAHRSRLMAGVRTKGTSVEERVALALERTGLRFKRNVVHLPGKPDFVLASPRLAVFANGCFWHGHACARGRLPATRRTFWRNKIAANRRRDGRVARQLRTLGYSVHTVWECRVNRAASRFSRLCCNPRESGA